jgi:dipeptidyl aminopeptidase/acylaminoacyl peptidase
MSFNSVVISLHKRMVISMYQRIALALLIVMGMVSCSRPLDITSTAVHKISRDQFANIDWSQDGSKIFAIGTPYHGSGSSYLYSVDVATGKSTKLTKTPDVYDFPSWSPDGEKVALTFDQSTIGIFEMGSGRFTHLTTGEGAVWLSDGDRLAVYVGELSNKDTDHREIRIVDLQGNVLHTIDVGAVIPELHQLKPYLANPDEDLTGIDISPDGEHLIFSLNLFEGKVEGQERGSERQEAYSVNLQDDTVLPYLPEDSVGSVAWSANGTEIAYIRPKTLSTEQLVIASPDGNCLLIPDLPPEIRSPTWSKDGSHLAFLYGFEIHIMDMDLQSALQDSGCP